MIRQILFLLFISPITIQAEPAMISHAGGFWKGAVYTNSKEAFQSSYYHGFHYIEVDLRRTSDGHTVLIHDWNDTWEKLFHQESKHRTYADFMSPRLFFTQLDLRMFLTEMRKYPNLKVILDIKEEVLSILKEIALLAPDLQDRLIPQIFTEDQSLFAKKVGFQNFLLALYRMDTIDPKKLISFFETYHPQGFTISKERVFSEEYSSLLKNYPTYVFTVNSLEEIDELKNIHSIHGIFTDRLSFQKMEKFHKGSHQFQEETSNDE